MLPLFLNEDKSRGFFVRHLWTCWTRTFRHIYIQPSRENNPRDDVFGEWLAFTLSAELQKVAKWCSELYENVAHEKPQEILRLLSSLLRWWSSKRLQLLVAEKLIYFTLDAISSQLLLCRFFLCFSHSTSLLLLRCLRPTLHGKFVTMKILRISSNSPEKSSTVERLFKVLAVSCVKLETEHGTKSRASRGPLVVSFMCVVLCWTCHFEKGRENYCFFFFLYEYLKSKNWTDGGHDRSMANWKFY